MYTNIRLSSAVYSTHDRARTNNLRRAVLRRRGRVLTPVALVVCDEIGNRRVSRAHALTLTWRERVLFTDKGWRWFPPAATPTAPPLPNRDGYVRVADTSGVFPNDPRIVDRRYHHTVRYGWVVTGWLYVEDMFEVRTDNSNVRQWVAPTGELYVYRKGADGGDAHAFEVYVYEPKETS